MSFRCHAQIGYQTQPELSDIHVAHQKIEFTGVGTVSRVQEEGCTFLLRRLRADGGASCLHDCRWGSELLSGLAPRRR